MVKPAETTDDFLAPILFGVLIFVVVLATAANFYFEFLHIRPLFLIVGGIVFTITLAMIDRLILDRIYKYQNPFDMWVVILLFIGIAAVITGIATFLVEIIF